MLRLRSTGGGSQRAAAAQALVAAGVAVMGHVGLTPQSISTMGGFRPQGRSSQEAVRLLREAHALQVRRQALASSSWLWRENKNRLKSLGGHAPAARVLHPAGVHTDFSTLPGAVFQVRHRLRV